MVYRTCVAVALGTVLASARAESVTLETRIELPGTAGRLDHLAVDLTTNRLFIAALGADTVEVVDLQARRRVWSVPAAREPQGVAFAHGRLFVASGEGGNVQVFEGERAVSTVRELPDADNLRLTVDKRLLFIGYGQGMAVLDTRTLAIVWRAPLSGHPEAFELSPDGSRVYVNVPTSHAVEVLDAKTGARVAFWSIAPLGANYPMALDIAGGRLFVATRTPASLLVIDLRDGRQLQRLALCGDADDLLLDARRERLYAVCGGGELRVLSTREADRYVVVQRVATTPGARTGLFVPELDRLFIASPQRAHAAEVLIYRPQ